MTISADRAGVFARNHATYLEYAVNAGELDPRRLVTFRSSKSWVTARKLLEETNEVPIYFAVVDEEPQIKFKAWLREVVLAPHDGDPSSDRLLHAAPPDTDEEGYWNGKVATLYAVCGCHRLASPYSISCLRKLKGGEPISEDFGYSYALVRLADGGDAPTLVAADYREPPSRLEARISRVIRSTAMVQNLKRLHNDRCQRCDLRLELSDGSAYSEGHHLKPLGGDHAGPDIAANILILCPNCHALLDLCAVQVDRNHLRLHPDHAIDQSFLDYHNVISSGLA